MNFDLGPHELALRDGIRELCAKRFPMERVREGFTRDAFRALAEAGVFSLRLPEDEGGVGLGMTEAVIVFEELGRALVPGPLVATHMAAGFVRDGQVVGGAHQGLVEYPNEIDAVLVCRRDGVRLCPPPDVVPVESLDPLTPLGRALGSAEGEHLDVLAEAFVLRATALTAALASGIATKTTDLAVAYAKDRVQFDRPIGSFQAVKHLCADMLVRAEVARAAVDAAGVLLDADDDGAARSVYGAKLLASEYAVQNAKTCVQVYGGMGFTWEADVHLYLKRAAVLSTRFGDPLEGAELVAASL